MAGSDFIAYHALVRPGRPACIDLRSGEALDYRALDDRVARTAGLLSRMLGGARGERVATLSRNSLEAVVLHYACARAGAIYAPLNWRLSGPELAALAADAEPALLFHEEEFDDLAQAAAAGAATTLAPLDAKLRARTLSAAPFDGEPTAADAPWTLLYTSGATGRPKGVIVTRDNARAGAANLSMIADIGPASVMLCDPPLFHTVGLFAIAATALQVGGTLVLSDRFHAATTLKRLSDPGLGVTHYFGVPQIGQMLAADPGFDAADLSRLRAVLMGGAPLPVPVLERFAARGVVVSNGFGMTETCSVMHMPLDLETVRARPGCVGAPTPFVSVRIVRDGRDMPPGEVGELWLKGPGITQGYWRQPEATAAAFEDGWLRTGDAAVREADGFYRLVDRWKDMYISGGENVYPAEVEAVIALVPGVAEVAVVGVPDPRWGETGCAFVAVAPGAEPDEAAIHDVCGRRLAAYKRPSVVRFIEALPRTGSGKVLKDALRRRVAP